MKLMKRDSQVVGSNREKEIEKLFSQNGYFIHFLEKSKNGSQPFDFFAIKNENIYFFDSKNCSDNYFRTSRIELNQYLAFKKLLLVGVNKENVGFLCYFELLKSYKILKFYKVFYQNSKKNTYRYDELEDLIL